MDAHVILVEQFRHWMGFPFAIKCRETATVSPTWWERIVKSVKTDSGILRAGKAARVVNATRSALTTHRAILTAANASVNLE